MQTSPSCFAHSVLLKIPLFLKTCFITDLESCVVLLENFWKKFDLIWSFLQIIWKVFKKTEKKRKKRIRKRIRGQDEPIQPSSGSSPWPISFTSQTGTLALSLPLTSGAPLTGGTTLSGRHQPLAAFFGNCRAWAVTPSPLQFPLWPTLIDA
jgi:hypothetical protein